MKAKIPLALTMASYLFLAGCADPEASVDSKPEIRWGFTTQNFIGHVPVTLESSLDFLRYAKDKGLVWIELRDPDASLTVEECREIAALAAELGIEVNYSAQRGLLTPDFFEVLERVAVNTAVFEGPRTVRVLALRGEHPYGWTEEEFEHMVAVANEALGMAAEHGVGFTVENADGVIAGNPPEFYGMTELFEAMAPLITLQLDTANLFTGPEEVTPEQAASFIESHAQRISYLHVKSARDGEALPFLDGNPLSFEETFELLSGEAPIYAVIELGPNPDAESVYENMRKSLDYLKEVTSF